MIYPQKKDSSYYYYGSPLNGSSLKPKYFITFDLTDKATKNELIFYVKREERLGLKEAKDMVEKNGTSAILCFNFIWEWLETIQKINNSFSIDACYKISCEDEFIGQRGVVTVGS